eukprot:TRINITY_DN4676_c0_g1_i10.p1 TRINITY_DN4676_c0_g1~~TRINITY_DN4676_c0_g1_i10.p1  ORF type:complete len:126 (+),score=18.40 TRINITY_DN4676_c0_g1_i10:346-723(+)
MLWYYRLCVFFFLFMLWYNHRCIRFAALGTCARFRSGRRWSTAKRLGHLRAQLHEPLKKALGKDYSSHFRETPFAHHCGLPGTTKRLDAWCQTLAVCMSTGMLSPPLIAQVLRELDAPPVPGQPA